MFVGIIANCTICKKINRFPENRDTLVKNGIRFNYYMDGKYFPTMDLKILRHSSNNYLLYLVILNDEAYYESIGFTEGKSFQLQEGPRNTILECTIQSIEFVLNDITKEQFNQKVKEVLPSS